MTQRTDWPSVWREIRTNVEALPRCVAHPEYRRIETLARPMPNDVLRVEEDAIVVCSHETGTARRYCQMLWIGRHDQAASFTVRSGLSG